VLLSGMASSSTLSSSTLPLDVYQFGSFPPSTGTHWIVDKLVIHETINLLVGDSGIGKTPFAMTLGIAVAAGVPFLGRATDPGRVLYCDAESRPHQSERQIETISTSLGLAAPPANFYVYGPYFKAGARGVDPTERMLDLVRELKPSLIIVDTMRAFWTDADTKSDIAAKLIKTVKTVGGTWLITHHPRKVSREFAPADLATDPNGWMQEAAGSRALINHTDSRLGVIKGGTADILIGGFVRCEGNLVPIQLKRVYDLTTGEPLNYELATGVDFLTDKHKAVFSTLPSLFHFKDVVAAFGGKSASSAARFIQQCKDVKVIESIGKAYAKKV
jgi:AAA domain